MELTDQERRIIELLRSCYCAEVLIAIEHGIPVRAERIREKVLLDRPLAGQLTNDPTRSTIEPVEY